MGYNPWGHKESDGTEQLTLPLLRYSERQRILVCCSPWCGKESDMT